MCVCVRVCVCMKKKKDSALMAGSKRSSTKNSIISLISVRYSSWPRENTVAMENPFWLEKNGTVCSRFRFSSFFPSFLPSFLFLCFFVSFFLSFSFFFLSFSFFRPGSPTCPQSSLSAAYLCPLLFLHLNCSHSFHTFHTLLLDLNIFSWTTSCLDRYRDLVVILLLTGSTLSPYAVLLLYPCLCMTFCPSWRATSSHISQSESTSLVSYDTHPLYRHCPSV